jgi:hypothetical protein
MCFVTKLSLQHKSVKLSIILQNFNAAFILNFSFQRSINYSTYAKELENVFAVVMFTFTKVYFYKCCHTTNIIQ